jgi:hypothetical protein
VGKINLGATLGYLHVVTLPGVERTPSNIIEGGCFAWRLDRR